MQPLIDLLPALLVATPLLGAIALLSGRLVPAIGRTAAPVALAVLLVNLFLAATSLSRYAPTLRLDGGEPLTRQHEVAVDWYENLEMLPPEQEVKDDDPVAADGSVIEALRPPRAEPVRFALAFDGISLGFVLMTGLLSIMAWDELRRQDRSRGSCSFGLLFLAQASAATCFLARDGVLLLLASGGTSLCLAALAGVTSTDRDRQAAALRLLRGYWLSDLLLLFAVAGLAAVIMQIRMIGRTGFPAAGFDLDLLTFGVSFLAGFDPGRLVWRPLEGWLFTAVVLSIALKLSLFPFHRGLVSGLPRIDSGGGFVPTLPLLIGIYLAVRFLVPLFGPLLAVHGMWLTALLLVGLLGAAVSVSRETEPRRMAGYLLTAAASIAGIGVLSMTPEGMLGGLLLTMAAALGVGGMCRIDAATAVAAIDADRNRGFEAGGTQADHGKRCFLGAAALAATPGLWLILLGIARNAWLLPGRLLLGFPLLAGGVVVTAISAVRWAARPVALESQQPRLRPLMAAASLVLIALAAGSPAITRRMEPTIARLLRQPYPSDRRDVDPASPANDQNSEPDAPAVKRNALP